MGKDVSTGGPAVGGIRSRGARIVREAIPRRDEFSRSERARSQRLFAKFIVPREREWKGDTRTHGGVSRR